VDDGSAGKMRGFRIRLAASEDFGTIMIGRESRPEILCAKLDFSCFSKHGSLSGACSIWLTSDQDFRSRVGLAVGM
jgi:hypothetical protein